MTANELDVLECPYEAMVYIKINAHAVRPDGSLSDAITYGQEVITESFRAESRAKIIEKIENYLQEKSQCLKSAS